MRKTIYWTFLVVGLVAVAGSFVFVMLSQTGAGPKSGITQVALPAGGVVYASENELPSDIYLPVVVTSSGQITVSAQMLSMFSWGENHDRAVSGPPLLSYTNKSFVAAHDPQVETIYSLGRSALVVDVPSLSGEVVSATLVLSDCLHIANNLPTGVGTLHVGTWANNGLPSPEAGWSAYDTNRVVGEISFTDCPASGRGQVTVSLNPQMIHAGQPLRLFLRDSEDRQALTSPDGQDAGRLLAAYHVYLRLTVR